MQIRDRKKTTGNNFLDGLKSGDIYSDEKGQLYEVIEVVGPDLSAAELRRLRRAAFRLIAAPAPR